MTPESLTKLLNNKDKLVQELLDEYLSLIESPYYSSYIAHLKQIESWNAEITKIPIKITGNDEEKAYDRVLKYLLVQDELLNKLNGIRLLMKPAEQKEIQQKATSIIDEVRQSVNNDIKNNGQSKI
jgi:hypothetical protein